VQCALQKSLQKAVAKSMWLARIKQEREKIRVAQLLASYAKRLEDIEGIEQCFKMIEIVIGNCELR
jgi:hypothetical protein